MIAQDALRAAIARLRDAAVPDPARDARILLAFAMGIAPDRLTLHLTDDLSPNAINRFDQAVTRRRTRQPVSQIIGRRQFFGHDFTVTPDVLDPRPETETLVQQALLCAPRRVLDLGTGSGCVLLSILAEHPAATGMGVDISAAALHVAKANAQRLSLCDRARFVQSNWFQAVTGRFDLIVSNPPYISESEWRDLAPEPKQWEPKIALTPGMDGLSPYRTLAGAAGAYITPHGWLMVEIGWQQGPVVAAIFAQAHWENVAILPDLNGHDRVVVGQWPRDDTSDV